MAKLLAVTLNGVTIGAVYFLIASGFTLIFGLMRVVNLAHGTLYAVGAYTCWAIADATGNWWMGGAAGALVAALLGFVLERTLLRRIAGQDLREALVTIGVSIVGGDLLLAYFGGDFKDISAPAALSGAINLHIAGLMYPTLRLFALVVAAGVGISLWFLLRHTRLGLVIRAGIDDRAMVSALGIDVQRSFAIVFALGALLAGLGGVIGGSMNSIGPGDDGTYLLNSLIVVIVGGMGSIVGTASGAVLIGLVEQYGLAYASTYSSLVTFAVMIAVLAFRPQGLLGRRAPA
jgi:branched-chain amino acid transport system permease protein